MASKLTGARSRQLLDTTRDLKTPVASTWPSNSIRSHSVTFEAGRPSLGNLPLKNKASGELRLDARKPTVASLRATTPGGEALAIRPSASPPTVRGPEVVSPVGPSTATTQIRVKGINFTTALHALHRLYGPAARERIERDTPGELGNALRFGGIVIGGWYPVAWYREFWRSLNVNLGIDEAAAHRIGHRAAGLSVNVAYRALSRMSSPATLLAMSARAFGYYFETGSLLVKQPEPKRLTAEWRDCHGFDSFIWSEVEGGAVYFIEATGATEVTFTVLAGGGSASSLLATATWR